ncbi:ribosomal L1 domain-containing protein 1 [Onthophagus taurus]|uniref:ribosomal L1 domain-containing protein 1 n=1 Tax=Onthophagus taurus TaxID=166361 RepID=UPI0039BDB458
MERNTEKKRLKIKRKIQEENEPGKYVRLNKPGGSQDEGNKVKKFEKKLKLEKKLKKLKSEVMSSDNEESEVKTTELSPISQELDINKVLNQLNFDKPSIISGIHALFKILEQKKNENQLLDLDTPIFLLLSSFKVPICPARTVRLPLKHMLHDEDSTVCFIVSDVDGIIKKEHEKVAEYYEKLFIEKGVETKINKILPLHELKTEYNEFEMKRKLLATYDVFFVDGKISKYVSKHLGKIFYKKRRLPIPIRMEHGMAQKMKYAMLRTSINIQGHGNSYSVQIGHCHMKVMEIFENILTACEALAKEFPGGWENIKVVNLKTDLSMAVPLYISLKNPDEIQVPKIRGKRAKSCNVYSDELSTKNNSKVTVYPSGRVLVEQLSAKKRKRNN